MISPLNETPPTLDTLIARLEDDTGVLKSAPIKAALRAVPRARCIRARYLSEAYEDYPVPVGFGQTISQPTTVVFMLELLQAHKGDRVLEVGSGSGWVTALLAHLVGAQGKVYGVELVPELVAFGRKNLKKYALPNATIAQAGAVLGLPGEAPFDRILVSASAQELPGELVQQLKDGGTLVIPIGDTIYHIEKREGGEIKKTPYPGFAFVPLIT